MQDLDELRIAAEAKLAGGQPPKLAAGSVDELLHELQVHQIELEMQNKTLRKAHFEIEKSRDIYVDLYDFPTFGHLTPSHSGMISGANLNKTSCRDCMAETLSL